MTIQLLSRVSKSITKSTTTKSRSFASLPRGVGASSMFLFPPKTSGSNNTANFSLRQYTTHSQLPEEHQMIHEMCRKFADEELAPNAREWDQKHMFPQDAVSQLVRMKF